MRISLAVVVLVCVLVGSSLAVPASKTTSGTVTWVQYVQAPVLDMTWAMGLDYDEFYREAMRRGCPSGHYRIVLRVDTSNGFTFQRLVIVI